MNKKFKYRVWQGNFTESGRGVYWDEGEFDTLEEAQKRMYEICHDMNGISKQPNGYLETLIDFNDCGEDKDIYYHTIESIKYKYKY